MRRIRMGWASALKNRALKACSSPTIAVELMLKI